MDLIVPGDLIITQPAPEPEPGNQKSVPATSLISQPPDTDADGRIIIPSSASSDRYLELMNRKHAVTREAGKVMVVEFVGEHQLDWSTPREIEQYYRNIRIPIGDGASKPLGHWWLDHDRRRQYEAVVFNPALPATTDNPQDPAFVPAGSNRRFTYNRWRGLAIKPKNGDWSLYYDNLLNNMCGGNETYCRYVLDWMAHGVQHPEEKPGTAIVFRSDERGTGKSTVCRYYVQLFGPHGLEIASADHLTGRFNEHLETLVVLVVNEAIWAGDHSAESILKSLITESSMAFEGKYKAVRARNSYLRVMMTANSSWVVPAGWSERRFLVLEASDRMLRVPKYWIELAKQMKHGGLQGLLHDLLARDISTFNPRNVPVTEALIEQKIQSMDEVTAWLYTCLARGKWKEDDAAWRKEIGRNELYELYRQEGPKISRKRSGRSLQIELGKLIGRAFPGANDGPRLRVAGERIRTYLFGDLESCRSQFARYLQAPEGTDLFYGMEPDNRIEMIGSVNPSVNPASGTIIDFSTGKKLPNDDQ